MITNALAGLLKDAMDSRVSEVNTCLPAKVKAYYPATQTADLLPCVKRPMPTDTGGQTSEPIPEMLGVPVAFPRAGDFIMHLPLQAEDFVLLVFSQFSIGEFLANGHVQEQQEPDDVRHHSMSSAVAIAGVFPNNDRVSGLSATEALLGNPAGHGVKLSGTKTKVGNLVGTMKRAARKDDPISVTLSVANIAAMNLANAGGQVFAALPVTLTGQITEGSTTVDISD